MRDGVIVLIFGGAILAFIIAIAYISYKDSDKKSNNCHNAGGQPITERGVYKFCMKRDYVLEVK